MALLEKYNGLPMPNLRLNRKEVDYLLEYIATETERLERVARLEEAAPAVPGMFTRMAGMPAPMRAAQ